MKLTIRRANTEDVPALMLIEEESFSSPHWQSIDFLKNDCYVAEIADKIVGFLVSREVYRGEGDSPPEREIMNVATAPEFRRRGIATALISQELGRAGTFFLEVRESNRLAQALYHKLGFKEVGRRAEYYSSPTETAIVMNMKRC